MTLLIAILLMVHMDISMWWLFLVIPLWVLHTMGWQVTVRNK